jgi:hypothetical protein
MSQKITKIISNAWALKEDLSVADWGSKYMTLPTSPFGSRFRPEMSPWLIEPLEAMKDDSVREIVLCCSAQSSKSTYLYLAMLWSLAEDPSPVLFFAPTEELSKRYARTRIMPMLEQCAKLKHLMPQDRKDKQLREILFPNASLMIGAASPSFAQSWTAKVCISDESARFRNDGVMSMIRARTTQYFDSKNIMASTPYDEDDDFYRAYLRTSQNVFHLSCPSCGELIRPEFDKVIRWENNSKTKVNNEWVLDEVAKTVYMLCPHCETHIQNTDKNWRAMTKNGGYVQTNKDASPGYQGYRWNALCLPPNVMPWSQMAVEFLTAKREMDTGYFGSLKEWVRLRCGLPWNEQKASPMPTLIIEPYDASVPWEDAAYTFMAIDCHGKDTNIFWVGVRSFDKNGNSRLMHYSREVSWEACEKIRAKFNIPSHLVAVDSSYSTYIVYQACAKYGFTAWRGEETTNDAGYPHNVRGRTIRRPWSVPVRVDIKDGSKNKVTLFRWSNNLVKDALHYARVGKTHGKFLVGNVGEYTSFYVSQIDGEVKKQVTQKRTGKQILRWVKAIEEQHAVDIEGMCLVMAMMANIPLMNHQEPNEGD